MRPVEQHDDPEQACLLQLPLLTCGRRGPSSRDTRAAAPAIAGEEVRCYVNTPTIAPIKHVVSVPETIDFRPSALISSRRVGAMVPRPPIMMPRLAKLAKQHIA